MCVVIVVIFSGVRLVVVCWVVCVLDLIVMMLVLLRLVSVVVKRLILLYRL